MASTRKADVKTLSRAEESLVKPWTLKLPLHRFCIDYIQESRPLNPMALELARLQALDLGVMAVHRILNMHTYT